MGSATESTAPVIKLRHWRARPVRQMRVDFKVGFPLFLIFDHYHRSEADARFFLGPPAKARRRCSHPVCANFSGALARVCQQPGTLSDGQSLRKVSYAI